MIITKEGTIDIAVGEVFAYNGRVYGCKTQSNIDILRGCEVCVGLQDSKLCNVLECHWNRRVDGHCVIFVPYGEMEGGKDEK